MIALPAAESVPDYPDGLETEGRLLWERLWKAAAIWLSPATDIATVQMACELADGVAIARRKYLATHDSPDARAWVQINAEFRATLSALGFDPTARARLGVAEVKAASKLDELIERRQRRGAALADGSQR